MFAGLLHLGLKTKAARVVFVPGTYLTASWKKRRGWNRPLNKRVSRNVRWIYFSTFYVR